MKVRIKTVSRMGDDRDQLEAAQRHVHHGEWEIGKTESILRYGDETGESPARVTLRMREDGEITLLREGENSVEMAFHLGEVKGGTWNSSYGSLELAIATHHMELSGDDSGGRLFLSYDTMSEGQHISSVSFEWIWKC